MRKEALESSQIEGTHATLWDIYAYETDQEALIDEDRRQGTQEVVNYLSALTHGLGAITAGDPITVDLLREMHERLLSGVRGEETNPGELRTTQNYIGTKPYIEDARYVPPPPSIVPELLEDLVEYANREDGIHPLLRIGLVHYQFETIHPFLDGNGRLGRVLVTLQLYQEEYLDRPNLYLSEYFNRNKETYVERMRTVSRDGEWEAWLQFFLTGLAQQARESYERTLELHDLQERYEETYGDSSRSDARLALQLFEQPYLTANDAEEMLGVSGPTAYRAIHALEEVGVLDDADVGAAAATGAWARNLNGGQSCIAAKRFLVHDAVYDAFVERFVSEVESLTVGAPMERDTDVGPLTRRGLLEGVHEQVSESVAAGATVLTGGEPLDRDGAYYPPTVLADVPRGCPVDTEEVFGPVAAVYRVPDEDRAVEKANETEFGLGASVWTGDLERGERVARRIDAGCTYVNELVKSDPRVPFGGVKASGYGRELSGAGITEFVNRKTVWRQRPAAGDGDEAPTE